MSEASHVPEDVRRAIEAFVPAPDCELRPRTATETSFIFDWGVRVAFEEDGRPYVAWICLADEACRNGRDSMFTLSHGRTSRATRHLRQVHDITSDKTERTDMATALGKRRHDGSDGELVQRLPSVFSIANNAARYVGASPSASGPPEQQIQFIATTALLQAFLNANDGRLLVGKPQVVGVDFLLVDKCPEHQGRPCLAAVSIAGDSTQDLALVLLVQNLDKDLLKKALRGLWIDTGVVKAMHALRRPAVAWYAHFGDWLLADPPAMGNVDLQLLFEHTVDSKERDASVAEIATAAKVDDAISNLLALSSNGGNVVARPPEQLGGSRDDQQLSLSSCHRDTITIQAQKRVVRSARLLARVYARLRLLPVPIGAESARVADDSQWKQLVAQVTRMTRARCENAVGNNGALGVWFDRRADYQLRTLETLVPRTVGDLDEYAEFANDGPDEDEDVLPLPTLRLECNIDSLLDVLPQQYSEAIARVGQYRDLVTDVSLDIGRVAYVYVGMRQRVPLKGSAGERMVVTKRDVDEVLELLGGADRIGNDNRVGIDGQLHRVSVMRSKKREVYGVTIRVGRALLHAASGLMDLLLSPKHRAKSVLLLGHPRSGKTTMLRDVARFLSETQENVCIIDTFNEIGGEGIVPHESVGWARRMMVSSLAAQPSVMVECVQNHPVETMVVDEISRKPDVMAASMVRQRGVRLVVGALGDLNSLLKHLDLCGLLGGMVQEDPDGEDSELRMRRVAKPMFDVIVELDRQAHGVFRIIWDVAAAVDCVLDGRALRNVETRRWTATTRGVQIL